MGDMADDLIEQMERGESYVRDKRTGREFWIDNIALMYGGHDLSNYEILEDDGE